MKNNRNFNNVNRLQRTYKYFQKQFGYLSAYMWANYHIETIIRCYWNNNIPFTTNDTVEKFDTQIKLLGNNFYLDKNYFNDLHYQYNNERELKYDDWSHAIDVIYDHKVWRAICHMWAYGVISRVKNGEYISEWKLSNFKKSNVKKWRIFRRNIAILKKYS